MKRRLAFLHASPAAIAPLAAYYATNVPEYEITNLLDDGLLRVFGAGDASGAQQRLARLLGYAIDNYGAELALVTCSAVSRALVRELTSAAGIPAIKIDAPMAAKAVELGPRIGVIVTFPPTRPVTEALIREVAEETKRPADLDTRVVEEAYDALLTGNAERHDELLLAAISELAATRPGCIVLSQVSMARVLSKLPPGHDVPVLTSLSTSLTAVRAALPGP